MLTIGNLLFLFVIFTEIITEPFKILLILKLSTFFTIFRFKINLNCGRSVCLPDDCVKNR